MNAAILIGVIILIGLGLGWVLHHRSVRHMMPILRRLVAEENGVVKSQNLVGMPKLLMADALAIVGERTFNAPARNYTISSSNRYRRQANGEE